MESRTVVFVPELLCENLLYLRKKASMSQADVAKDLGVSQNSVWKYESGQAEPSLRVVCWYAGRFGVSLDNLLTARLGSEPSSQAKGNKGK